MLHTSLALNIVSLGITGEMSGLVCVSLGTSSSHVLNALAQLDPALEMAEIRVDLLSDYDDAVEKVFTKAKELGIATIATVRDIKADPGFSQTRLQLLKRCMKAGSTFVDIEVESPEEYRKSAIESAKEHKVRVIISHHEYAVAEKSSENLPAVIEECFSKGADVAKLAVAVCSAQGAARVLALYNDKRSIVALGMGESGKVTRVASISLGAPFSFAAWDAASATAPGQLTREQMKSALSLLGWSGDSSRKRIKSDS